ncbi:MAG: paraquat-inducible protein A, partial [Wenzhouxiangellaceae bacterium]|nr:paraquat-inducible protein A [Wenzhouxiangellaceae bacterium]
MPFRSHIVERRLSVNDHAFIAMLLLTGAMLVAGLTLPAFTNDRLGQDAQTFSILGAALNLRQYGSHALMAVIILFSAVFPTAKLLAMSGLWLFEFRDRIENRGLRWLEMLGKWSMLDVFVVATVTGASHLKILNRTDVEFGIYVFGLAILMSLLASIWLRQRLNVSVRTTLWRTSRARRALGITISLVSLVLFVPGIFLPLLSIEKWLFWNKDYSLVTALPKMVNEGEFLLPVVLLVFVIVLPLARFVALTLVRLRSAPSQGLVKLTYGLEKWTMWEVYALALVVVAIKLGDLVEIGLLPGFWFIMAVAPLSM